MSLWVLSFLSFFLGLRFLAQGNLSLFRFQLSLHEKELRKVIDALQEMEELLLAGLLPSERTWTLFNELSSPWRELCAESLRELRASGGSLIPTLKRLRSLGEQQRESLHFARAKSSQAMAQTLICGLFVPILGIALQWMVPVISQNKKSWMIAMFAALAFASLGAVWLLNMTEKARWGGIRDENRSWLMGALCAGEKFLALIRAGIPPDLAWTQTCQFLSKDVKELALAWKYSLWEEVKSSSDYRPIETSILQAGSAIKKSIQVSLMEGRPCSERVESCLEAMRAEIKSHVEKELSLLSTRALKPLFFCVAPGLLGLLAFCIYLISMDAGGGDFL